MVNAPTVDVEGRHPDTERWLDELGIPWVFDPAMPLGIGNGRSSIGIDLDARNVDLARDRIGMWLEVVDRRDRPKEATA